MILPVHEDFVSSKGFLLDGYLGETVDDPFASTVVDIIVRNTEGGIALKISIEPNFAKVYIDSDYNRVRSKVVQKSTSRKSSKYFKRKFG